MKEIWLVHSNSSVGEANLHLQFTPKYRRKVFSDEVIRFACEEVLKGVARKLKVGLNGIGFGPDHVHLFVSGWKNYSVAELARRFKGTVSRIIRKNCFERIKKFLWGKAFWSGGYFYRTVGAVNRETMLRYVRESQSHHWKEQSIKPENQQTTILQY